MAGWVDDDALHIQRPPGEITDAVNATGFYIDLLIEAQPLPKMKTVEPAKYERLANITLEQLNDLLRNNSRATFRSLRAHAHRVFQSSDVSYKDF